MRLEPNKSNSDTADSRGCSVCKDLLVNLQRFFDILDSARHPTDGEWLTVDEVAKQLKISKTIVYRLIRNGELEAVNIVVVDENTIARKGHYRIRKDALTRYLQSKKVRPLPPRTQTRRRRPLPKVKNYLGL